MAPLIAPVDTITPASLLYHLRAFYIVRYNSLTTQPSQPTYNTHEQQQRKRKRNKRRILKKQNEHAHVSTQMNIHRSTKLSRSLHPLPTYKCITLNDIPPPRYITTRHHPLNTRNNKKQNIKTIIVLKIITIPTFNISIQFDHFYTKSHILNTLPKNKPIHFNQHSCVRGPLRECRSIQSGASRLPYYCAALVCAPDVIDSLTAWQYNKPKTKKHESCL